MTIRPGASSVDQSAPAAPPGRPPSDQATAVLEVLLRGTGSAFLVLTDRRLRIPRAGSTAARLAERPSQDLAGMSLIAAFGSLGLQPVGRAAHARGNPR